MKICHCIKKFWVLEYKFCPFLVVFGLLSRRNIRICKDFLSLFLFFEQTKVVVTTFPGRRQVFVCDAHNRYLRQKNEKKVFVSVRLIIILFNHSPKGTIGNFLLLQKICYLTADLFAWWSSTPFHASLYYTQLQPFYAKCVAWKQLVPFFQSLV